MDTPLIPKRGMPVTLITGFLGSEAKKVLGLPQSSGYTLNLASSTQYPSPHIFSYCFPPYSYLIRTHNYGYDFPKRSHVLQPTIPSRWYGTDLRLARARADADRCLNKSR